MSLFFFGCRVIQGNSEKRNSQKNSVFGEKIRETYPLLHSNKQRIVVGVPDFEIWEAADVLVLCCEERGGHMLIG